MFQKKSPLYRHFCEECKHLGVLKHEEVEYDLYYCEKPGETKALFARFSNEPGDVYAYPAAVTGNVPDPIFQARRQARIQGYMS